MRSVAPESAPPALPLPISQADLSQVQAVFSDVDGTLTVHDRLTSQVIASLERLTAAGVKVVLVTGRPAGFAECWMRTLPVAGVIAENGGLYFTRDAKGRFRKRYARPEAKRKPERAKLLRTVAQAIRAVPGAQLSSDSVFTEVDIAIDYNEEVKLGQEAAGKLERFLNARGIQAVRSSVHVNAWIGNFDKRWMVKKYLKDEWKLALAPRDPRFVYVGDSFNDAPMFEAFGLSVGVANVLDVLDRMPSLPAYVTKAREGVGFLEVADAVIAAREAAAETTVTGVRAPRMQVVAPVSKSRTRRTGGAR
jgi:HAD superfamily hydrolase (TIGR01484 family)